MSLDKSTIRLNDVLSLLENSSENLLPRITLVSGENEKWKSRIKEIIFMDSKILSSKEIGLKIKRLIEDKVEILEKAGKLEETLDELLGKVESTNHLVITITDLEKRALKGIPIQRNLNYVYVIAFE